jgi:hypothetical protein
MTHCGYEMLFWLTFACGCNAENGTDPREIRLPAWGARAAVGAGLRPHRRAGPGTRDWEALAKITDQDTNWRVIGSDRLGGDWSKPAKEMLSRFRDGTTSDGRMEPGQDPEPDARV